MNQLAARSLFLAVAAAIGARASAQEAAPKHLLRNAYEVGKTTWYRETMAVDNQAKLGDTPMNTTMAFEVVFRCDTKEVVEGKATLRRTFTRVKAKATGPLKVDFDSADPESRPGAFGSLADMVDQWVEVREDERGRIAEAATSPDYP